MDSDSHSFYYVSCSDGLVTIDKNRMGALCEKMPVLRSLLFGHPNMQKKTLKGLDGTPVLEIPVQLQVNMRCFTLLMTCALDIQRRLPSRASEASALEELEETMYKLGGCATLESKLHNHNFFVLPADENPKSPAEDTNNRFLWQIVYKEHTEYKMNEHFFALEKKGYSFVGSHEEGYTTVVLYFRKEKVGILNSA